MFWVEGFIEISKTGDISDEDGWTGVVSVGPIVDVGGPVSGMLFGLSKCAVTEPHAIQRLDR